MFDIPKAIESVSTLADSVVKRIWPDATEVEKAKLNQLSQEIQNEYNVILSQLEINKAEANSGNGFASNWRPLVGYICAAALAYSSILEPLLRFIASVFFHYTGNFPILDTTITGQILTGLLGLGAMRSYDKRQGTVKK